MKLVASKLLLSNEVANNNNDEAVQNISLFGMRDLEFEMNTKDNTRK